MGRAYVCNKWKSLCVRDLQFDGGLFVAKNKEEEKIIESSESYKIHIWPRDGEPVASPEESAAIEAVEAALTIPVVEREPAVRWGQRGTGARKKK